VDGIGLRQGLNHKVSNELYRDVILSLFS